MIRLPKAIKILLEYFQPVLRKKYTLPLILLFFLLIVGIYYSIDATKKRWGELFWGYNTDEKVVVLTFDDGPDYVYTPLILNVLRQKDVKAAFFVIGANVEKFPAILREIEIAGHEIGVHTFSHSPNIYCSPDVYNRLSIFKRILRKVQIYLDLKKAEWVIRKAGVKPTHYLRLPFTVANDGTREASIALGYHIVDASCDPRDWEEPDRQRILNIAMNEIGPGGIILLHDGGGNRWETVQALPVLIDTLRRLGYRFARMSEMKNYPRLSKGFYVRSNLTVLGLLHDIFRNTQTVLLILFVLSTLLIAFRYIGMSILALGHYLKIEQIIDEDYQPLVSILVPAYNEEKIIAKTIESLEALDYKNFEVIVINDGSKDRTAEIVENYLWDPRIRLINKTNGGKSKALNTGVEAAQGEIIVIIDADTQVLKKTLSYFVQHFKDPKIGAVAGNVRVGNRRSILTRWQSIEYIVGLNLDRRMQSFLNCITVVPGACGAYRKQALLDAGLFTEDILIEDADITVKIRKAGYQIVYEEKAIGITEAPMSVKNLVRQRYRWTFGNIQLFLKHKDVFFNSRYGFLGLFAFPYNFIFGILLPIFVPLVDIVVPLSFFHFGYDFGTILPYCIIFGCLEAFTALLAVAMDGEYIEDFIFMPLQRIFYRQLLWWVLMKSIWRIVHRPVLGWMKVERTNTVPPVKEIPSLELSSNPPRVTHLRRS